MPSAAFQHLAFTLALVASAPLVIAVESPTRAAPSRPGASAAGGSPANANASSLVAKKFGGVDYVNLADAATRLGLKFGWVKRGKVASLTGTGARAEIEADSREATVNGLRVFLGDKAEDAGGQLYVSRIDFERCLAPLLRPGYGGSSLSAPKVIALDPGHGGKDQGTSVNEKTYALDVAHRVRKLLEKEKFRVVLTRDEDVYLPLAERSAIANAAKADLFVSIHFNAEETKKQTSGVELYTFPPATQRSIKSWSPGRENDAEKAPAPGNDFDHWNVALAQAIHRHFVSDLKTIDRGKKIYHLGVLRGLKCPGALVECGFLTSDAEARKISTAVYRQQIAQAIAAGIRDYAALVGTTSTRLAASTK
jgi:N-acetylmuramoyl-L-alanine amidase